MSENVQLDELHKEIDLIQACITRMADNAFRLKEWYISLITIALTLLIGQECKLSIIGLFMFGVTTVFWGLDAFFLKMETLYHWKYEWVISERMNGNRANMYDLNPHNRKMWLEIEKKRDCILKFILSKTMVPLYGVIWTISIIILGYVIVTY